MDVPSESGKEDAWHGFVYTVVCLGLAACAGENPIAANFTQAEADTISGKCDTPEGFLKVRDGQMLMWNAHRSNPDASMCIMGEVRATGKLVNPVGNEMHVRKDGR